MQFNFNRCITGEIEFKYDYATTFYICHLLNIELRYVIAHMLTYRFDHTKLNIKQYIKNIFIKQDCLIYSLALWKFSQLETNIPLNPTKITQNLYKIFY